MSKRETLLLEGRVDVLWGGGTGASTGFSDGGHEVVKVSSSSPFSKYSCFYINQIK